MRLVRSIDFLTIPVIAILATACGGVEVGLDHGSVSPDVPGEIDQTDPGESPDATDRDALDAEQDSQWTWELPPLDAVADTGMDASDDGGEPQPTRCELRRPGAPVPLEGPVDCTPIGADPRLELCDSAEDHCLAVALGVVGCRTTCAAAGLECLIAYTPGESSCQIGPMKPCEDVADNDLCWCAPAGASFEIPIDYCRSGRHVVFDPYGHRVMSPFPSDLYTRDDPDSATCLTPFFPPDRVPADEANFSFLPILRGQLERLDGFGTSAKIAFEFNTRLQTNANVEGAVTAITPESTTAINTPILLVDIDPDSPDRGRPRAFIPAYYDDAKTGTGLLLLHPTVPLRPATRYAAIVTRRLATRDTGCLGPSPWTARLLEGRAHGPGFDRISGQVAQLILDLPRWGYRIERKDIAGLTVFTTMDPRREMIEVARQVLEATTADPPRIVPGSLTWEPSTKPGLRWNVDGEFESITYRDWATGVFQRDEDGRPKAIGKHRVKFRLRLPDFPGPDEGGEPYRIFAYHHGLGGSIDEGGGVAERLGGAYGGTPRGWAVGYISTIHHGERCTRDPFCVPPECVSCGDGTVADGIAIQHFFGLDVQKNFLNVEHIRDNFRQDYVDWLVFLSLLTNPEGLDVLPAGEPDGIPDIVDDKVGYTCLSLGGVMGGGIIALSPDIEIAFDNVGGGGVLDIILKGLLFGSIVNSMGQAVFAFSPDSPTWELDRWFPLLQTVMDPGDPVNFAQGMFQAPFLELGNRPKPVLFQMVNNDTTVPPITNESLGRAAGTVQVGDPYTRVPLMPFGGQLPLKANGPGGITHGYNQFSHNCQEDGSGGGLFDARFLHGDMVNKPVAVRQWRHFFETFYASGTAEIINPYAPPFDCR